jgi:hypothetical protein
MASGKDASQGDIQQEPVALPADLTPRQKWLFTNCQILLSRAEQDTFVSLPEEKRILWLREYCFFPFQDSTCSPKLSSETRSTMFSLLPKDRWSFIHMVCSGQCSTEFSADDRNTILSISPQDRLKFIHMICSGKYALYKKCKPSLTEEQKKEFETLPIDLKERWISLNCKNQMVEFEASRYQPVEITEPKRRARTHRRGPSGLLIAGHVLLWNGLAFASSFIGTGIGLLNREAPSDVARPYFIVGAVGGGCLMIAAIPCFILHDKKYNSNSSWAKILRRHRFYAASDDNFDHFVFGYGGGF